MTRILMTLVLCLLITPALAADDKKSVGSIIHKGQKTYQKSKVESNGSLIQAKEFKPEDIEPAAGGVDKKDNSTNSDIYNRIRLPRKN